MKKELSPGIIAGVLVVVVALIAIVGFKVFSNSRPDPTKAPGYAEHMKAGPATLSPGQKPGPGQNMNTAGGH